MHGPSRTTLAGTVEGSDLDQNDPCPISPTGQTSQTDSQGSIQRIGICLFGGYGRDLERTTLFEQPQMEGRRSSKSTETKKCVGVLSTITSPLGLAQQSETI